MKRVLILLVGLLAVLLPAAPAMADVHVERLAFVDHTGVGDVGYIDIEGVQVVICKRCAWWVHLKDKVGNPEISGQVLGGLQYFAKSKLAADPDVAARYQATAIELFATAARIAGPEGLSLGEVGIYDVGRRTADPSPNPWLVAAGQHLAAGVNLLAADGPRPHPWIEAAVVEFDKAYQALAEKRVG